MKPMLFNTNMVRAILENRKTVTRRVVKPQPPSETHPNLFVTPPYCPGDILYVRETWSVCECEKCRAGILSLGGECSCEYVYRTDYGKTEDGSFPPSMFKWRPSIHMPREAARIFLRVTDVRVERLHDITPQQAISEGVGNLFLGDIGYSEKDYGNPVDDEYGLAKEQFAWLWDSTIKPADRALYGWDANPYVFVISFERISKEEAEKHDKQTDL